MNAKLKFASREVNLLTYVRHPNIVQTLAVCLEANQLHVLMELVDGHSLSDILFDEEIRNEYNLDIATKNHVAKQICLAVNYLHLQNNPIIQRDIKPDNILVTKQLVVKLCDLGLSKFKSMATALRSTTGNAKLKGTPIYMAPELLLNMNNATVQSEVWAIGCTLIELYKEASVWELDGDDEENLLKQKLVLKAIPDTSKIPSERLRGVVEKCFSHESEQRPSVTNLLEALTLESA